MKMRLTLAVAAALVFTVPAFAQMYTTADPAVAITDNSGGALSDCQTITVGSSVMIMDTPSVEIVTEHSWAGDTTYELSGPGGTPVLTLVNRPGRSGSGAGDSDDWVTTSPIRLGDFNPSGVSAEDAGIGVTCGDLDGSPGCETEFLPAPDGADTPVAGQGTSFADFTGIDAMGTWTLCASDSAGGDTGTLTSWSLGINGSNVPVELQSFSID